jgi:hypothetical protein
MLTSINLIERKGSNCKYVEIFTHRVGSIGAASRRAMIIRKTNTKQKKSLRSLGVTRRLTFSKREVQYLRSR